MSAKYMISKDQFKASIYDMLANGTPFGNEGKVEIDEDDLVQALKEMSEGELMPETREQKELVRGISINDMPQTVIRKNSTRINHTITKEN